jgi:hypothetical protein
MHRPGLDAAMTDDDELPWMRIPNEAERTVKAALESLGIAWLVHMPVKCHVYQPIEIVVDATPLLEAIAAEVMAQLGRHGDAIDGYVNVGVRAGSTAWKHRVLYKPRRRR